MEDDNEREDRVSDDRVREDRVVCCCSISKYVESLVTHLGHVVTIVTSPTGACVSFVHPRRDPYGPSIEGGVEKATAKKPRKPDRARDL